MSARFSLFEGEFIGIPLSHEGKFGLLYVEPIYLQAEGVDLPELKKVIMATQEKVVMTDSVPNAVKELLGLKEVVNISDSKAKNQSNDSTSFDFVKKTIESLKNKIEDLKGTLNELEKSLSVLSESLEEK